MCGGAEGSSSFQPISAATSFRKRPPRNENSFFCRKIYPDKCPIKRFRPMKIETMGYVIHDSLVVQTIELASSHSKCEFAPPLIYAADFDDGVTSRPSDSFRDIPARSAGRFSVSRNSQLSRIVVVRTALHSDYRITSRKPLSNLPARRCILSQEL
ncbi:Hypothetical protein CINCED_3A006391 [Cinara cedri]|uniref:Uncharacterized protein n=1 Tax=Cinara cedri TaxID=506608 RepID=A0A5E4MUT5_9HEMI|nr:Hypothetical protein CINCED_3A006391 [Cinara cedri]